MQRGADHAAQAVDDRPPGVAEAEEFGHLVGLLERSRQREPASEDSYAASFLTGEDYLPPLEVEGEAGQEELQETSPLSPMDEGEDASVQDIQLELLRRTSFNALDGEQVVASLLKHRDLWLAALLDRPGVANYAEPKLLLTAGLIKLRDLPYNLWNADSLFILTETREQARQLLQIIKEEDWGGEVWTVEEQEEIDAALGTGRQEYGLVQVWWD